MLMAHDHPRPEAADWRDSAACRGMDPDLFFPSGFDTEATDQAIHAIYGGQTSHEIRRARRRQQRRDQAS